MWGRLLTVANLRPIGNRPINEFGIIYGPITNRPQIANLPHKLVYSPRFAIHVIHQQVLAEIVWRGEVGFASAQLRDFLNEIHQSEIAREHEGVDQDALLLAAADFFQR